MQHNILSNSLKVNELKKTHLICKATKPSYLHEYIWSNVFHLGGIEGGWITWLKRA
jgi:hypothetical protein